MVRSLWKWTTPALLVVISFLSYNLIFSDHGYLAFRQLQTSYANTHTRLEKIQKDNERLSREIILLKNDREYLETVVRTDLHLLHEDEILYLFPKPYTGEKSHE